MGFGFPDAGGCTPINCNVGGSSSLPSDGEHDLGALTSRFKGFYNTFIDTESNTTTQVTWKAKGIVSQTADLVQVVDSSDNPYLTVASDGDTGVGVASPSARFHGTGGSLFWEGATGGNPISGAGTYFLWDPAKGALRAGAVSSTQYDDANVGTGSVAFGDCQADGTRALGFGDGSNVAGTDCIGMGLSTDVVAGSRCIIIGAQGNMSGNQCVGVGNNNGFRNDPQRCVQVGNNHDMNANVQCDDSLIVGMSCNMQNAVEDSLIFGRFCRVDGNDRTS